MLVQAGQLYLAVLFSKRYHLQLQYVLVQTTRLQCHCIGGQLGILPLMSISMLTTYEALIGLVWICSQTLVYFGFLACQKFWPKTTSRPYINIGDSSTHTIIFISAE
jgi:hypothetical protein